LQRILRGGLRAMATLLLSLVFLCAGFVPLRAEGDAGARPDVHFDLDTGGHRAFVKDVVFAPGGDLLVSASDDKTIRVWDWRAGVTLRTIRGKIGPGHEGKVFAVDVSPDGATIAAGGWFGPASADPPTYGDVRLFDLRSGRMTAVLSGHPWVVYDVAFSPDGTRLAAAGQGGFVHLWTRGPDGNWRADPPLDADCERIEKIAFAAAGRRLAAVTSDYGIRLWDMADASPVELDAAAAGLEDVPVRALAVSPDGARFATGADDGQVMVWRAQDGSLAETVPQREFLVGALTFADAGRSLVISCGYRCADRFYETVWTLGGGERLDYRGHDNTVWASDLSPDGALVASAGGTLNEVRVWDPLTGETKAVLAGRGRPVMAVGITVRGDEIAWGNVDPCPDAVACTALQGELAQALPLPSADRFFERPRAIHDAARFARAFHAQAGWSLAAADSVHGGIPNDVLEIRRGGDLLHAIRNDATNGIRHAAFTLLEGGLLATGGSDGTLSLYDRQTGRLVSALSGGHSSEINAMAEAAGAQRLITGGDDQTVRLWNLATGRLVASMFFAGDDFILWVPQGYYYSSPDGDSLVGWHVNQGSDREARFVRARQLKQYLFSPEIVRRAIVLGDAEAAVRELRGVDSELDRLLQRRPPEFEVRVLEDGSPREGFVSVEITGAGEEGASVAEFAVHANDRRIDGFATRAVAGDGRDRIVIEVPVEEGENEISIAGVNAFGYLTERSVKVVGRASRAAQTGTLYVVAIGAEDYPLLPTACSGRSCNLSYPVDDAAEFVRVLAERTAPLYREMKTLVFANADALAETAAARETALFSSVLEPESDLILDEIEDFLGQAGPDDTTIIFVAGHGINIDEDYYFIPSDGRQRDGGRWQRSSLVGWETIQRAVERAKGRRLMLVDTCHAANSFNPRLEKDAEDARIIVFSATAANNTAAELPELGHGVFTFSLLEGLKGRAGTNGDGVRLLALADFVDREVRRLTASRQAPEYYISRVDNFVVARP
jgi:WD40 repeat protein/uncharacterized caspase-like protein